MERTLTHISLARIAKTFSCVLVLLLPFNLHAQEEDYVHISRDLGRGLELQEVSDRAYENAEEYWEYTHGHERTDHEHEEHGECGE